MASIEILENTLLKLLVRRGTNVDRQSITLTEGELGYVTDTGRLFIGDGSTQGGVIIGNRLLGANEDLTLLAPGEYGDLGIVESKSALYAITQNTGSNINDWTKVGQIFTAGDGTITINDDGDVSVASLSAGNFSADCAGESIEIDSNGRIALKSQITVDQITRRNTDATNYLKLPTKLEINNLQYRFPSSFQNKFYLKTDISGNLTWANPSTDIGATFFYNAEDGPIPVGTIMSFLSASNAPIGWLLCNGQEVNGVDYPELSGVIGESYGSSSPGVSFKVPNFTNTSLYGVESDPASSTLYNVNSGTNSALSATGALFIVKATPDEISNPSLIVKPPLYATLNAVDTTDVIFNPLSGAIEIGLNQTRTILPGLSTFDTAGTSTFVMPAKEVVKFFVTGAGAYGGNLRTGGAAATCIGYLSAPAGKNITVEVGDTTTASGNPSKITIDAADVVVSNGANKGGGTAANTGTIELANDYVVNGYIIPGGCGNVDTNNSGSEESEGAASYWGSTPSYGAGGSGHGRSANGQRYSGGKGVVIFEW